MPRPPAHTRQPGPPFDSPAARKIRAALGMSPEHVAYSLRASYDLPYATPELVIDWERGTDAPSAPELAALAGVLWCSPADLIGRPRTLHEHRIARGLAPEDVARAVGHEFLAYVRMEESGQWRGTERQSAALAELLDLSLPDLVAVTGEESRLAELLRAAVRTRWQAYAKAVGRIVPLDRRLLEEALQELHRGYQGQVATPNWGDGGAAGRDFLDMIVDNFWTTLEQRTA
ncbi:helix-turn-helix transcriptional regulator [Streptomyces sp. NBC_01275]|uniref:helix-turn-helix domain-containing protein n=1 Tax=Streptomyces sp. NBC_01275 TaxID=2903807 RepID=UPI00225AA156|nr:helix-turn-helix transcriptional regulator [Streptomyces sp. NBC_01275]MCX4765052.1 helix-turn-helix transcriptional regulator [Streptomyces sp. NBC_01275]